MGGPEMAPHTPPTLGRAPGNPGRASIKRPTGGASVLGTSAFYPGTEGARPRPLFGVDECPRRRPVVTTGSGLVEALDPVAAQRAHRAALGLEEVQVSERLADGEAGWVSSSRRNRTGMSW